MALVMMMSMLAACGGGGSSSEDGGVGEAEEPAAVEPNAGVGDIVFVVPDGWTLTGATAGSSVEYKTEGSDYTLIASIFSEKDLKEMGQFTDADGKEIEINNIQDYYNQFCKVTEESKKENNLEDEAVKVCDVDGTKVKRANDKGECFYVTTSWLEGDKVYSLYMSNFDAWTNDGKYKEGAQVLSDADVKMYDGILASVQHGDGDTFAAAGIKADSLGEFTFDTPQGFTAEQARDNYVSFKKDGSDNIHLSVHMMDLEDAKQQEIDGKAPESLKEYFDYFSYGEGATTIADCEANVQKIPEDNGNYYYCSAMILTDDAIYRVDMNSDNSWDDEGNIKEDAESFTEEDLAAFDAFLESLKKK